MKPNVKILYVIFCLVLLVDCRITLSQVRLPQLIRDSMILQRDAKVNIWGWAKPGEKVEIKFNKKKYKTTRKPGGNPLNVL